MNVDALHGRGWLLVRLALAVLAILAGVGLEFAMLATSGRLVVVLVALALHHDTVRAVIVGAALAAGAWLAYLACCRFCPDMPGRVLGWARGTR